MTVEDKVLAFGYLSAMINLGTAVYERKDALQERCNERFHRRQITGDMHSMLGRRRLQVFLESLGYVAKQWNVFTDQETFLVGEIVDIDKREQQGRPVRVITVDTTNGLELRTNHFLGYQPTMRDGSTLYVSKTAIMRNNQDLDREVEKVLSGKYRDLKIDNIMELLDGPLDS